MTKNQTWTGRVLTTIAVLFMLFDSIVKFTTVPEVVDSFKQLGYPTSLAPTIGVIELLCLALYLLPRTSVFGAVMLTGYLGGAVATHVRIGNPLLTHALFPIYIAFLLWLGLFMREPRLRVLLPLRATETN